MREWIAFGLLLQFLGNCISLIETYALSNMRTLYWVAGPHPSYCTLKSHDLDKTLPLSDIL